MTQRDELATWWRDKAEAEIEMVVSKAVEYGARDLSEMGRSLSHMAGRDGLSPAQHAELGCVMYLVGKMARVEAAWAEGRAPSDDTYLDIGVYVRMIQRIRETGGWPGGPQDGPGGYPGGSGSPLGALRPTLRIPATGEATGGQG